MEELAGALNDRFLRNLLAAFTRRQAAIRQQALETELECSSDPESVWITCRVTRGGHRVRFAAALRNRASLEVLSGRPRSRGRVLLRQSDLRLVDAAVQIADTFEWTLGVVAGLDVVAQRRVVAGIAERWKSLALCSLR